jgi:hypothetical protein
MFPTKRRVCGYEELVGGPSVRLHHEFLARVQERRASSTPDDSDAN